MTSHSEPNRLEALVLSEDGGILRNSPVEWSPHGAYIQARNEATADECREVVSHMGVMSRDTDRLSAALQLSIGRLILDYAARTEHRSIEQSISELDLEEITKRDWRTIAKWARIIEVLPESQIHKNLTASQLYAAASVQVPEDPRELVKFIEDRHTLLEQASKDPETYSYRRIERDLKDRVSHFPSAKQSFRRTSDLEVLRRSCLVMWIALMDQKQRRRLMIDEATMRDLTFEVENVLYERKLLPSADEPIVLPAKIQ